VTCNLPFGGSDNSDKTESRIQLFCGDFDSFSFSESFAELLTDFRISSRESGILGVFGAESAAESEESIFYEIRKKKKKVNETK